MVPSKRLKPIQRVAENREQAAVQQWNDAQQAVKVQESRLEQLIVFQQEYQQHFDKTCQTGLTAHQFLEFRAFMAKLQLAIQQQENVVEHTRHDCQCKKGDWQDRHTHTQAIGKVIERCCQEELEHQERREQKDNDERAQRRRVVFE